MFKVLLTITVFPKFEQTPRLPGIELNANLWYDSDINQIDAIVYPRSYRGDSSARSRRVQ